jgi:hypothetical protein
MEQVLLNFIKVFRFILARVPLLPERRGNIERTVLFQHAHCYCTAKSLPGGPETGSLPVALASHCVVLD